MESSTTAKDCTTSGCTTSDCKGSSEPSMIKLYYFDFKGRGEPIRLALTAGKIPFEDIRVPFSDVPEMKKKSPTLKFPFMEVGDYTMCESGAMTYYACQRGGFLPECPLEASKHLMIRDMIEDVFIDAFAFYHAPKEQQKDMIPSCRTKAHEGLLRVEKLCSETRKDKEGFLFGSKMGLADFVVANVYETISTLAEILDDKAEVNYPTMHAVFNKVIENEEIKAYRLKAYPTENKA